MISELEQLGAVFQVTVSSSKVSQACALIVREDVPVTLVLYRLSRALVGVIAEGNGISDRSKVSITRDSPEPLEGTPNSNGFWLAALFGLLESMLASGTPGKSPVFSKTDP